MRVWIVLLAACGHAPAAPRAEPARRITTRTHDLRARVAVARGGSWTDIRVDGTDDSASSFCARLVERELRGARGVVELKLARGCAAEVLPAAPDTSAYRLVELRDVTSDDVSMDDLLAGHREKMAHAIGHLIYTFPAADRAACDALKTTLEAEDARAAQQFLNKEIALARDDEKRWCEMPPGMMNADAQRRRCSEAAAERIMLEQNRAEAASRPQRRRSCESR